MAAGLKGATVAYRPWSGVRQPVCVGNRPDRSVCGSGARCHGRRPSPSIKLPGAAFPKAARVRSTSWRAVISSSSPRRTVPAAPSTSTHATPTPSAGVNSTNSHRPARRLATRPDQGPHCRPDRPPVQRRLDRAATAAETVASEIAGHPVDQPASCGISAARSSIRSIIITGGRQCRDSSSTFGLTTETFPRVSSTRLSSPGSAKTRSFFRTSPSNQRGTLRSNSWSTPLDAPS